MRHAAHQFALDALEDLRGELSPKLDRIGLNFDSIRHVLQVYPVEILPGVLIPEPCRLEEVANLAKAGVSDDDFASSTCHAF